MLQETYNHEAWHGIHPLRVELTVEGLQKAYTFFHFTDLHMGEYTEEELAAMTKERAEYTLHRQWGFSREGKNTAERMKDFFDTAKDEGAELILMTGDMADTPTDQNIAILKESIASSDIQTLFVVGNHDWSFADDYHTDHAKSLHMPKFESLSEQGVHIHWVEYEDLLVVAVDDSLDTVSSETTETFLSLCRKGKPIVLILHVPLYEETLSPKCRATWGGKMLMLGGEAPYGDLPAVKTFYEAVAIQPNTPVVAVIAGHLHFHFHSELPNGVPQYVTDKAYTGGCLTISLKPKA